MSGRPYKLGSFLTEPPPAPPAPPPAPPRVTKSERNRAAIRMVLADTGTATLRELMAHTGLTMDQVNAALWLMQRHGLIRKAGTRPRPEGQRLGRRQELLYALVRQ